jgi:tetratricopeptide (TPR) repeat protein
MNALARRRLPLRAGCLVRRACLLLAPWFGTSAVAQAQGFQAPQAAYFLALPAYYDGDYVATQGLMLGFLNGAIKNPAAGGFWIDAICYETMRGESHYQMGQYAAAYKAYENALWLLVRFNNWMLSVQFPPAVVPAPAQSLTPIPWHLTQRATVIGGYPPTMNIMQGNINNNQAVFQGGVVQPPVLVPIYVQEIVRCSCLAIRRWRELLGPVCPYSEVTRQLVQKLSQRPVLPNHWSESWFDVQLGLAYAAAGQDPQARKVLENAELCAGSFDHPFTGTVHLELGRLDFAAGNLQDAQKHFLEASWAAANYKDFGVVEEALRWAATTHYLMKSNEPFVPLAAATTWATAQGLQQLQASLLLSSAENLSMMDKPQLAAGLINQAMVLTARTNLPQSRLGARMNHLNATVSYQLGRVNDGDVALTAAMAFQSVGSLWMYQIRFVDLLWDNRDDLPGQERTAMELYTTLLRDPTPTDWLIDPLESLSVLAVPHVASYENWFDAALVRKNKDHERAMEIADMTRRHRFLTTIEGGRLLNLRWLLEAPRQALDETAMLQRQTILGRYPEYDKKSREAKRIRNELRKLPLVPDEEDTEVAEKQTQLLSELTTISAGQEAVLRLISVRREPGNIVFPPLRTFKQTQESLKDGQSLLAFFTASRYTYGFLLTKEKYAYWDIKPNKRFAGQLVSMLQKWGNFEQNKELKLDDLVSEKWKAPAQEIMKVLVQGSKADFTRTLEELVIVPDGMYWYIPFEALPTAQGAQSVPLLNRIRIRYAPTVGLALGDTRRRKPDGNLAVVKGKLYPRDEVGVVDTGFDGIARAMPEAVAIRGKLPAPGAVFGSLIDRLIVLNEIAPPSVGYEWSPLQSDSKSLPSPLTQWLSLPFSGPDQMILPGFRTPAERAFKGDASGIPGNELFLSTCGLMAAGARTVLISRWRTGGQSSVDLVREFVQELPHTTASDAWQRSVQLVSNTNVNVLAEPRLNVTLKQSPPKADHPFFWAGYLLADTGALPMTGDEPEEPAEPVLVAKQADAKPNAQAMIAAKLGDAKPGDGNMKKPDGAKKVGAGGDMGGKGFGSAPKALPPVEPAGDVAAADPPKQAKQPTAKARRVRPPPAERKKSSTKQKRDTDAA